MIRAFYLLCACAVVIGCTGKPINYHCYDICGECNVSSIGLNLTDPHEKSPMGVPKSYDWHSHPKIGKGNKPSPGYNAFTGWGQVFLADGFEENKSKISLKNIRVYIFSTLSRKWSLVQSGPIYGRIYNSDYNNNVSFPLPAVDDGNGISFVLEKNKVFHFWPKNGRIDIVPKDIGGVIVTIEAKANHDAETGSSYLIGLGGDYWTTKDIQWDSYKTNEAVAIGQLRLVSNEWRTYFMTTSNSETFKQFCDHR